MMMMLWCVGVTLVTCLLPATKGSSSSPPKITTHPSIEIAYKAFEKVDLPCLAKGDPEPVYKWTKNGVDVTINGKDIFLEKGTLSILYPKATDEGLYQCTATNSYGTAVSVKTNLKQAVMDAFATAEGPPPIREPVVGEPLTLECHPPKSYPTGVIYWATTEASSGGQSKGLTSSDSTIFNPIATDARVTTDYQGWLRFAHVEADDMKGDKVYICIHNNKYLRTFGQGEDHYVRPQPPPKGGPFPKAAAVVWNSPSPNVVLVTTPARMKCIFKGYPTPQVTWTKVGGSLPTTAKLFSAGLELAIPSVTYADAGTYRCTGVNSAGSATVDIILQVESAPTFTTPAEDASPLEGDDASFTCRAGGVPTPTINWSLNGKLLSEWKPDSRRTISHDLSTITFTALKKTDTMVLQCNASNVHGYSFDNAVLNVIWKEPSIEEAPLEEVKVVVGSTFTFKCRVFGAPRPTVSWLRDDDTATLTEGVDTDGFNTTLTIKSVTKADAGWYYCHAENIYGEAKEGGELIVRDPTQIITPPVDQSINVTQTATFACGITVDEEEKANVKVVWYRNGIEVNTNDERYSVTPDHTLVISNAATTDTGTYRCAASTGVDTAESEANLVVKDRPDSPVNVGVKCLSTEVEVSWEAGSDNNDPISEYIITYETNAEPGVTHEAVRVPAGSLLHVVFKATPYLTHTVSVRAVNSVGSSGSSVGQPCTLPPAAPAKHPDGVCVESRQASQLIIVWTPMTLADLHGPGFYYTVNYRRQDQPNAAFVSATISDYTQRQHIVSDQPTMTEYEIYVTASNSLGSADTEPKKMIGYSGEGKPLDRPGKPTYDPNSLNATSVVLQWSDVDRTPARVKGYFRGFRITFWSSQNPDTKFTQDVILTDVQLCWPKDANTGGRRRRDVGVPISARLIGLKPYKQYSATVSVLNLGQASDASDPVTFMTPEHVPGSVLDVSLPEKASHSILVQWTPTSEPNGVIIGHEVIYQPVGSDKPPTTVNVTNGDATRQRLSGLTPNTQYEVKVRSCTKVGCGAAVTAPAGSTAADGPADKPVVAITTTDTTMNVTWSPSASTPVNPGEAFYIQYREKGSEDWVSVKASPADSHSVLVSGLKTGVEYEVVVVALNGAQPVATETRSDVIIVRVGRGQDSVVAAASSAQWVIILLALLVLLVLIIIIVLAIRYNRGQKYAVGEKEKLYGHRPDEQDEEGYGPYARPRVPLLASTGPVASGIGAPESDDEDDLDVYDQLDPTKFNEEGSFIGQYGGRKKGYDVSADTSAAAKGQGQALSTFV